MRLVGDTRARTRRGPARYAARMVRTVRWVGIFVGGLVAPGLAGADAIGIPEDLGCPEGARVSASHGAYYCAPASCSTGRCEAGQRCEERRVCTRGLSYREGSRTWPPPPGFTGEHRATAVTAICARDGACTGDDETAPRASGPYDPGNATCSVQPVCVPAPPEPVAPPSPLPVRTAPPEPARDGCAVRPTTEGGLWALCALVVLALRGGLTGARRGAPRA